jgi:hypothetical protein
MRPSEIADFLLEISDFKKSALAADGPALPPSASDTFIGPGTGDRANAAIGDHSQGTE